MENPRSNISKHPPYILKFEIDILGEYIEHPNYNYRIMVDSLPEPYIGNPLEAKIIMLLLNPGHDLLDTKFHNENKYFRSRVINNLHHVQMQYPFYLLDPKLADSPGYNWWNKILGKLIKDLGREKVSQSFAAIEYFPYHSKKYNNSMDEEINVLPSQLYNFFLVKQCIKRRIPIIMARKIKEWEKQVPELKEYDVITCKNVQRPWISPGNFPHIEDYERLLRALSR